MFKLIWCLPPRSRLYSLVLMVLTTVLFSVESVAVDRTGLVVRSINQTCVVPDRPPTASSVAFEEVGDIVGGGLGTPTAMRQVPGDSTRWFISYNQGKVAEWTDGAQFTPVGTVLDISDRVVKSFEGGGFDGMKLVGMVLHPNFQQNGEIFVYYGYNSDLDGDAPPLFMRLSRFRSLDGGLTFDSTTEEILLSIEQFTSQHKGGNLEFGADGFLYIGVGDDLNGPNGQDLNTLKGKFLRIDVDSGSPYSIPADNPFAGGGGLSEIYAWGVRQPWRWSFDRDTGELWVGDVGTFFWDEVNRIELGRNYGWPIWEGLECLMPAQCAEPELVPSVTQFPNVGPTAIIGGYVYHGSAIPELKGVYIYADGRKSTVYGLFYDSLGEPDPRILMEGAPLINAFAEGDDGELYILSPGPKKILRLVSAGSSSVNLFPQLLSETGCVDPNDPTQPASGLIPYDVNSPLWTDGAEKRRWMALPDWLVPNPQIQIESDGDFTFPIGTVLIKEFSLQGKRIETRLFMRHADGEWNGYSYEWNDQETDAVLLPAGKVKQVGSQTYTFPSRSQCLQCHSFAAGRALGPEIAQLNGDMTYPGTGETANQLITLDSIGVLEGGLARPPRLLPRLQRPDDPSAPIDLRARAYLHANCSMCHRPGGNGFGSADYRYYVADLEMAILNTVPSNDLGVPGAVLFAPGDPASSVISMRMNATGQDKMPPLGRSLVDLLGLSLIDAWIGSGLGFGSPVVHVGKVDYQAGADYGFFIWQDEDDGEWHLRWSGDGSHTDVFSGTVTATGTLSAIRVFSFEGNDILTPIDSTSFNFSAVAGTADDGIDFFLPDGVEVIFDLFINGVPAAGLIKIGSMGGVSPTGTVSLMSNPATGVLTGGLQNLPTVGPPVDYVPRQDVGYVLWQDFDDNEWHLRWVGSSTKTFRYDGIIASDKAFSNVRTYQFENNDELMIEAMELRFKAFAGGWEDGIDFFVQEGARVSFNLITDDSPLPGMIRIGPDGSSPTESAFILISSMTSISVSGQPSYIPAQNAGYFLWQDIDDSEWHLRWSGDSVKNFAYEGTITSSGGISSFSTFNYEANDVVSTLPSGLGFSGLAGAGEDGLDFFVPAGSQLIFDLKVDGAASPLSVSIGAQNTSPTTIPFSLFGL